MDVRMVAADLDDTLVRSDKSLSAYTCQVFRRCREQGILTAFATARLSVSTKREQELLAPDFRIVSGGAQVLEGERTVLYEGIGAEVTDAFLARLARLGAQGVYAGCRERVYTNSGDYLRTRTLRDSVFRRFDEPLGEEACQIFFRLEDWREEMRLREAFPMLDWILYRDGTCAAVKKGVSKAAALRKTAALCGISPEQIAAFGDDEGDMEMLRMCGVGVAMGNALPQVKRAACYVTGTNDEDGAARFLERYVLQDGEGRREKGGRD